MNLIQPAYYWLAGSLVAAMCLDAGLMRLLLELFKPASAYVFWIGRGSKLATLVAWVLFFNLYWFPTYVQPEAARLGAPLPPMLLALEWGVGLAVLVVAAVTVPRVQRGPRGGHA